MGILNDTQWCRYDPRRRRSAGGLVSQADPKTDKLVKSVVASFGLDSIVLKQGRIPDRCYEIRGQFRY